MLFESFTKGELAELSPHKFKELIELNPEKLFFVGDEKQSRDLIGYLSGEAPEKLWESNIFGKSVYELIQEGLTAKLVRTPEDVRSKFRGSLTRIVNEGANGLICLIV